MVWAGQGHLGDSAETPSSPGFRGASVLLILSLCPLASICRGRFSSACRRCSGLGLRPSSLPIQHPCLGDLIHSYNLQPHPGVHDRMSLALSGSWGLTCRGLPDVDIPRPLHTRNWSSFSISPLPIPDTPLPNPPPSPSPHLGALCPECVPNLFTSHEQHCHHPGSSRPPSSAAWAAAVALSLACSFHGAPQSILTSHSSVCPMIRQQRPLGPDKGRGATGAILRMFYF